MIDATTWACRRCGSTELRYVKGRPKDCRACHRVRERVRYWRNPEIPRTRDRERAKTSAHRERLRLDRQRRPDYYRERNRLHRLERTPATIAYVAILDKDPCAYCGEYGESIDHIVPVTKGGTSEWGNLTSACTRCNSAKNNRSLLGFLLHRRGR